MCSAADFNFGRRRAWSALIALCAAGLSSFTQATPAAGQGAAAAANEPTTLVAAPIFTDSMVLQRDMDIPVWGKATPGASVSVSFGGDDAEATAGDDGRWEVRLDPMEAGGPHQMTITAGDESIEFKDVLIGDVWVASGQSNMEWPVSAANDANAEMAAADWPEIRFIDVPNQTGDQPRESFESAGWQACRPETVGSFSAVAYYFGRALHKELHVPIGLVGCNWGGTPMEAWTSREALKSSATFASLVESDAESSADAATATVSRERAQNQPAALYNGMISPIVPYGIRGVIWYQGESNAGRHRQYAELSKLMIADWRDRWGQGDFPFLLVQLAGWAPGGDDWPYLRQAQFDTLEVPNTGMAVTIDIGDSHDIHPRNKQEVGARLALVARAVAYGEEVEFSGPVFREMQIEDGKVRLSFEHLGGGLKAAGDGLKGFEVAGADGLFVPAEAAIDGAQVVVSNGDVNEPTAVRYNWAAFPEGNLYNVEGLPAVPFHKAGTEASK
jgi:sialate O-acetylesterase